jgi:hypothetical protein
MIKSSSKKFDSLKDSDDCQIRDKIREIKGSESEWQARIEVLHKPGCRIM